jgi:hypothetical protein
MIVGRIILTITLIAVIAMLIYVIFLCKNRIKDCDESIQYNRKQFEKDKDWIYLYLASAYNDCKIEQKASIWVISTTIAICLGAIVFISLV